METNESKQDYLERILMLESYSDKIKAIDLAKSFNFSRASISIALKKLVKENLVVVDEKQNISLTQEGRKIASGVYERHKLLTEVIVSLGIDRKTASADACKIEHDLSENTYNAIKNYYLNNIEKTK